MLNCRSGVPRSWARNPGSQRKFWHSVSLTVSTVAFIYPWTSGPQVKSLPYPFWEKIRIEWFLSSRDNSLRVYDLPILCENVFMSKYSRFFSWLTCRPWIARIFPCLPDTQEKGCQPLQVEHTSRPYTVNCNDLSRLHWHLPLMPGIHFGEKSPNAHRVQLKESKASGEGIQKPCSQGADDWCQSLSFGRWKCWQIRNFLTSRGTGATNRGWGTRNGWCRPHCAQ